MTHDEDRAAKVSAIALKALMLEPGDCFAVPIAGDQDRADESLQDILEAVERQRASAPDMGALFPSDDELAYRIIMSGRTRGTLVVERTSGEDEQPQ